MSNTNKPIELQLLEFYGVEARSIAPVQKGYRNSCWAVTTHDNQFLNLIIYKNEPAVVAKIKHANAVSDYLSNHQFPSRRTMGDIVQIKTPTQTRYACIYTYLPGSTIAWEAYTKDHIKSLGQSMSTMHALLANSDAPRPNVDVIAESISQLQYIKSYISSPETDQAIANKLQLNLPITIINSMMADVLAIRGRLPSQALHLDFVRSNILFGQRGGSGIKHSVIGVIDFEKTATGPVVFDIARTLAFLIVDCKFKAEQSVRKYFIDSGYNKRGLSTFRRSILHTPSGQTDPLELLIDMYLLHDFYKFLRHNPYESLAANEHYIRTRDILVARQRLMIL